MKQVLIQRKEFQTETYYFFETKSDNVIVCFTYDKLLGIHVEHRITFTYSYVVGVLTKFTYATRRAHSLSLSEANEIAKGTVIKENEVEFTLNNIVSTLKNNISLTKLNP